jgi:DNA-binding GntR family transcriptional regulator
MMGLGPIPRTRLVDEAVSGLREAILSGHLPAGATLNELDLAHQFQISRTPLREALVKLEQEGLIERLRPRGVVVKRLDLAQTEHLYDLRDALDGLAARLAAERIVRDDLLELERHVERMAQCAMPAMAHDWYVAHVNFHDGIFQASRNPHVQQLSRLVRLSIQQLHPMLLTTSHRVGAASREHREIFEAIARRDPDGAERNARAHIAAAREAARNAMLVRTRPDVSVIHRPASSSAV